MAGLRNIYEIRATEDDLWLFNEAPSSELDLFYGWNIGEPWRCPTLELDFEDEGKTLSETDYIWTYGKALSERAVEHMKNYLGKVACQPIHVPNGPNFFFIYPPAIPEIIDFDKSRVVDFHDGSAPILEEIFFLPEQLTEVQIFTDHEKSSRIFVSQEFVDAWNFSGLKGIDFRKRWPK